MGVAARWGWSILMCGIIPDQHHAESLSIYMNADLTVETLPSYSSKGEESPRRETASVVCGKPCSKKHAGLFFAVHQPKNTGKPTSNQYAYCHVSPMSKSTSLLLYATEITEIGAKLGTIFRICGPDPCIFALRTQLEQEVSQPQA